MMTHMQLLMSTFATLGIPFRLTDDSEQSPDLDDSADTVVVIEERDGPVCFVFGRDGGFNGVVVFGGNQ